MVSDYLSELLGGDDNSDRPSDGEMLVEAQSEIAAIEGGDVSGVAPWSTPEEALGFLRSQKTRYSRKLSGMMLCECCNDPAVAGYSDRAPRCAKCWTEGALSA